MLGDYAVPILENTETLPGEDQTGVVNGIIPYVTGVGRMELLLSGKVVDVRQVSKAAPDVESVSTPMAPEALGDPTAPIVVSWQAEDADSDQLSYTVQMSRDDGVTWETIAVGMSDTRIEIDRSQLEGLDAIKVRVIASDGFNSATLTSETISLKQ